MRMFWIRFLTRCNAPIRFTSNSSQLVICPFRYVGHLHYGQLVSINREAVERSTAHVQDPEPVPFARLDINDCERHLGAADKAARPVDYTGVRGGDGVSDVDESACKMWQLVISSESGDVLFSKLRSRVMVPVCQRDDSGVVVHVVQVLLWVIRIIDNQRTAELK